MRWQLRDSGFRQTDYSVQNRYVTAQSHRIHVLLYRARTFKADVKQELKFFFLDNYSASGLHHELVQVQVLGRIFPPYPGVRHSLTSK